MENFGNGHLGFLVLVLLLTACRWTVVPPAAGQRATDDGGTEGTVIDISTETDPGTSPETDVDTSTDADTDISVWSSSTASLRTTAPTVSCPSYDYSPCRCVLHGFTRSIDCIKVFVQDVKRLFFDAPSAVDWNEFYWTPGGINVTVPADLLGDNTFQKITIVCPTNFVQLSVELSAFRATSSITTQFTLYTCSLARQPDYAFLNDFTSLASIYFQEAVRLPSFLKMPSYLPNLASLTFRSCPSGLGDAFTNPNKLTYPKLSRLDLYNNNLADNDVYSIINAIYSNSTTLSSIDLSSNRLTRIPSLVQSTHFPSLTQLLLHENSIQTASGYLSLGAVKQFSYLTLYSNGLSSISTSFQGNFSNAVVDLFDNKLTRLDSAVFQPLLEGMAKGSSSRSGVYISQNPINCSDCRLAWLIRDNRQLLPYVKDGTCSNSTAFDSLSPESYDYCYITTTTTPTTTRTTTPTTTRTTTSTTTTTPKPVVPSSDCSIDFEDGTGDTCWKDDSVTSPGDVVKWRQENWTKPLEGNISAVFAPKPVSGTKYLRLYRDPDAMSSFAPAVFRMNPQSVGGGIQITFRLWIRSFRREFNNLQLFMTRGTSKMEELVGQFYKLSTPGNKIWYNVSVPLTFNGTTQITLAFYGFCGHQLDDAIAIDDISFNPFS